MSFGSSINGHKDFDLTTDEGKAGLKNFEDTNRSKFQALVKDLEGVSNASYWDSQGSVDLLAQSASSESAAEEPTK